jgi:4-hydroxy-3-polyprenylbenzoate decarboxylase
MLGCCLLVYFRDFREYLGVLEERGLLVRVKEPVVKETELFTLVTLQFRGLREEERRGFLFENVVDVKGRRYDAKVAVGVYAASREIYALGIMARPEEVRDRWAGALRNPIEPRLVSSAPCQEEVCMGDRLYVDGEGLESLPVPVEVPGFSGQIRTTTHFVTKDPETGVRNCGTYSGHIFSKDEICWEIARTNHGFIHWLKARKMGVNLPAAIIIGVTPNIAHTASAKIPYGVDEFAVAGGLVGEPVELVKCKTVDLEVPASAEIVIEGEVLTDVMEPGNAFSEYTGYMAVDVMDRLVFKVKCVTYRRNPVFTSITCHMPPSEHSVIRRVGYESNYYKFLKYDCNIPGILDVAFPESSGASEVCIIKLKKLHPSHAWQALYAAAAYDPREAKICIAVDEDIDPHDLESVVWALSFRMQPHRDVRIVAGRAPHLDLSAYRPDAPKEEKTYPGGVGSSAILIDATMKWPYPPVALPAKQYMERALEMWEKLGMPKLKLKAPWYGYELGYWPEDNRRDAELVVRGEHYQVGKRLKEKRYQLPKQTT